MRKAVAAVAVAGLVVLAGCTTTSNSSSPSGESSATADTRSVGVTPTTIKIGVAYLNLLAVRAVIDIDHGDYVTAYKALLDNINAHGGINGRKIIPEFAPVDPQGTSGAAQACTKLTQDDKVFAVIGYFAAVDTQCYVKTNDTPLVGEGLSPAAQKVAKAPWFNDALTDENLINKSLTYFNQTGVFTGQKVGVVGGVSDAYDVNSVAVPLLHKLGVNVVQSAVNDAPNTDAPAIFAQYRLIAQKFQTEGINTVVTVGSASETWPTGLTITGKSYRPRMVSTNFNDLQVYTTASAGYDPSTLINAIAGGGSGPLAKTVWNTPAIQNCVNIVKAADPSAKLGTPIGADPATSISPYLATFQACSQVALLEDILKAAGKTLNNSTFNTGGQSLGSIALPGYIGNLFYSADHHDGDVPLLQAKWNSGIKDWDTQTIASTGHSG